MPHASLGLPWAYVRNDPDVDLIISSMNEIVVTVSTGIVMGLLEHSRSWIGIWRGRLNLASYAMREIEKAVVA